MWKWMHREKPSENARFRKPGDSLRNTDSLAILKTMKEAAVNRMLKRWCWRGASGAAG